MKTILKRAAWHAGYDFGRATQYLRRDREHGRDNLGLTVVRSLLARSMRNFKNKFRVEAIAGYRAGLN